MPPISASLRTGLRMRVLAVGDNLETADTLAVLLHHMGHEVRRSRSG